MAYFLRLLIFLLTLVAPVSSLWAQYCTPTYNFVDCNTLQRRAYIYGVTLNNRTFSTGCSQAGYAGIVNRTSNGIGDPIVLTAGSGYGMTVNTYDYDSRTYNGYSNQTSFGVWIDYDRNGVFDNYELVRSGNSSYFVLYPYSSAAGSYRMRIRTVLTKYDPCSTDEYGETEDYLLQIVPTTPTLISNQYQYPCANSSFSLSASNCPYGTIQWRDQNDVFVGNNPASVQTSQNKSYYATCVVNGTASLPSSRVYAYPTVIAPPSISSNNYNLTIGQSAAITATNCNGTVSWSTGQTGSSITVLPNQTTTYYATCSGSYYAYCTSSRSNEVTISVNAPSAPTISASKNAVCPSESVTLSAGNCAGTVRWSTGQTGTSISVTPSQQTDYSAACVINQVEGARATTTISINKPTAVTSQPNQAAICEGSQASFKVDAIGSGNVSFVWTRNGQALSDSSAKTSQLLLSNVATSDEGTYQVRVTGSCGTVQSNAVALRVSTKMNASIATTPATCFGDLNGSATVNVSGGLDNKQYRLKDRSDYQSSSSFNGLSSGTYVVQVRDVAGCMTEAQADVKQPERITFNLSKPTNAKCAGGSDGAVDVAATGGNGGYQYSINGGPLQMSGQFRDLKANTSYVVRAVDNKGCAATTNSYVSAPDQLIVSAVPKSALCADGSTGSIAVTASGGSGTYSYQLDQNQPQAGSVFSGLKAATYAIAVRDANGCEGKAPAVIVGQPNPLTVTASATQVNCRPNSAVITLNSTGGTGQVQYQLGNTQITSDRLFANIGTGTYTINAKDVNGCPASTTVAVTKADTLLLQASTKAASCCKCADGSIALVSSGGTGQKQYRFAQQALQPAGNFAGIVPGFYEFSVQDEVGCQTKVSASVANASPVTVKVSNTKSIACAGGTDGEITARVAGGKGPYVYYWRGNLTDTTTRSNVLRVTEGNFTVSVRDSNGCASAGDSIFVKALNPLPAKPTISASSGSLISSAQSGVQWYIGADLKTGKPVPNATSATFIPFQSGSYFVVTTANGCNSPASDAFVFVLTAIEPVSSINVQVIPNPISGQLRIDVEQVERTALSVRLLDASGRVVLNVQTPVFTGKQQFVWPLGNTSAGVYLLQVEAGSRRAVQRVVVN